MTGDPPFGIPLGCQCPAAWWGTVPPYCPLHNPGWTVVTTTTLPLRHLGARQPWECTRCQRINAPHVDSCGCLPIDKGQTGGAPEQ